MDFPLFQAPSTGIKGVAVRGIREWITGVWEIDVTHLCTSHTLPCAHTYESVASVWSPVIIRPGVMGGTSKTEGAYISHYIQVAIQQQVGCVFYWCFYLFVLWYKDCSRIFLHLLLEIYKGLLFCIQYVNVHVLMGVLNMQRYSSHMPNEFILCVLLQTIKDFNSYIKINLTV